MCASELLKIETQLAEKSDRGARNSRCHLGAHVLRLGNERRNDLRLRNIDRVAAGSFRDIQADAGHQTRSHRTSGVSQSRLPVPPGLPGTGAVASGTKSTPDSGAIIAR